MHKLWKIIVMSSALVALAGCAAAPSQPQTLQLNPDQLVLTGSLPTQRSIIVTGDAEINVMPDRVLLTLGVETHNIDLTVAKDKADGIIREVLAFLKTRGVESKDIQTDYLDIQPEYDSYEHRNIIGFFVRENIGVTIRNVTAYNDILSGVLEAGVTNVYGVEFQTSELRKHRDEARAMAIKAAREKAGAMAGELEQEIGDPITITEIALTGGYYYPQLSQNTANYIQNASESGTVDGTLALGQISIKAKVSVEFSLK